MARKKLIAANWKMYKNPAQTREFFRDFLPLVAGHDRDEITICPPCIDLHVAIELAKSSSIGVGAQDVYWKEEGAFTGEISPVMLKLKAALEHGLVPIACIGEVLEEREAGLTEDVLRRQCLRAFNTISAKKAAKLVIAYEPVWAIGTGKTATPQMASDAHALIRGEAAKAFGEEFASRLRILYGGSVKPENAKALMSEEEIDGALVGGASLDPKSFAAIVKY
jgi:triosephosphate isomerase